MIITDSVEKKSSFVGVPVPVLAPLCCYNKTPQNISSAGKWHETSQIPSIKGHGIPSKRAESSESCNSSPISCALEWAIAFQHEPRKQEKCSNCSIFLSLLPKSYINLPSSSRLLKFPSPRMRLSLFDVLNTPLHWM